jgi:hypothetical protein
VESISLAFFFFDRGRPETQSLEIALKTIIAQIASQDPKYCSQIAQDIDSLKKGDSGKKESKDDAWALWKNFLSAKLERKEETKRQVYILLDGIDALDKVAIDCLIASFRDLSCDKIAIQVMITGSPDTLKDLGLKLGKRCHIDLPENTKTKHDGDSDIKKIITYRINRLKTLKGFTTKCRQEITQHLESNYDGMIHQKIVVTLIQIVHL